jgi:hypothetical protein
MPPRAGARILKKYSSVEKPRAGEAPLLVSILPSPLRLKDPSGLILTLSGTVAILPRKSGWNAVYHDTHGAAVEVHDMPTRFNS